MPAGVTCTLKELIRLRAQARGLELGARHRALSAQAGGYVSVYRGRGLEFDEVRTYQAGDDARYIDWRVTARRGRPHTKLFREERERPVVLLVDQRPNMFFGTRRVFKSVQAARAAALVAWAAATNGDRVGGLVVGGGGHAEVRPAARRAGVLALLRAIDRLQPRAPGPLDLPIEPALAHLARAVRPGSLVLLLTDFLRMGPGGESLLASVSQHNDVLATLIWDPVEALPPPGGCYRLGLGERRWLADTADPKVAERWRRTHEAHRRRLRRVCRQRGVHWMTMSTADDPLASLRSGLALHRGARA
jgi:uncharacterized protein (DUF58 family)